MSDTLTTTVHAETQEGTTINPLPTSIDSDAGEEDDYIDDDLIDDDCSDEDSGEEDDDFEEAFETYEEDVFEYENQQIDVLKNVARILKKLKKIIQLFNKATQLRELLLSSQEGTTKLSLINDIKTRWNYTLLMIERFLELYDKVLTILTNSKKHHKVYSKYYLTREEIIILEFLKQLLKPFYTVTNILSAEKYTTIDLVLNSILYIRFKLTNIQTEQNSISDVLKSLMLDSFNFYLEKYELLNNNIYIWLSPGFKKFNYATREEQERFRT